MPNITGTVNFLKGAANYSSSRDGVFAGSYTTSGGSYTATSNYSSFILNFNAANSSDAYWNNRTVLAAGVNMNWIIKY